MNQTLLRPNGKAANWSESLWNNKQRLQQLWITCFWFANYKFRVSKKLKIFFSPSQNNFAKHLQLIYTFTQNKLIIHLSYSLGKFIFWSNLEKNHRKSGIQSQVADVNRMTQNFALEPSKEPKKKKKPIKSRANYLMCNFVVTLCRIADPPVI